MIDKIKSLLSDDAVFYTLLILLVGISSFGLGKWSERTVKAPQQAASVTMVTEAATSNAQSETAHTAEAAAAVGKYVASKNGSKYHLPWCPGAGQMKEENKVWFDSKETAEAQGYTPAANCPGL